MKYDCPICGKLFTKKSGAQKFCSYWCSRQSWERDNREKCLSWKRDYAKKWRAVPENRAIESMNKMIRYYFSKS